MSMVDASIRSASSARRLSDLTKYVHHSCGALLAYSTLTGAILYRLLANARSLV
jgi:hypothetical protein